MKFDVYYYEKNTDELIHIERDYNTEEEAISDAETFTYGCDYEIKESTDDK